MSGTGSRFVALIKSTRSLLTKRYEHLDILSMGIGYVRSTRYKLRPRQDGSVPLFLTLREYETTNLPDTTIVKGTEWSKTVLSAAKAIDRGVWKLVFQSGDNRL
jgi:hypothetical protein